MIQLRCTKKVQDLLAIKKQNLAEPTESNHILGSWFVNVFIQERRKVVVYMNQKTLLSFIVVGIKKSKSKAIIEALPAGLAKLLALEGFSQSQISKIVDPMVEFEIAPTATKKYNGNMNDIIHRYRHSIYYVGGLANCGMWRIIYRINRTPQRNIDWKMPIEATQKLLQSIT